MMYYERIDISKNTEINFDKCIKKFIICYYWCILDKGFMFQPHIYNDPMMY